jgi:hypothetical protein
MYENHWLEIGLVFWSGFAAGWVLRGEKPFGSRISGALVLTSVALLQVPSLAGIGPAERRGFLWTVLGIVLLGVVVMVVMTRRQRRTAV